MLDIFFSFIDMISLPSYSGCYTLERDPETPHIGILYLAVSNFLFFVAAWDAYKTRNYFDSGIFTLNGIFSTLYHICKPLNGWFCILPYPLLYHDDFFTAFMNVPIVFNRFLPFRRPLLRIDTNLKETIMEEGKAHPKIIELNYKPVVIDTGLVNKDIILYVFYGILIATLIGLDLINLTGYLILIGTCTLVTLSLFLYLYFKFKTLPVFRIGYLVVAIVFLTIGALSFGIQPFLLRILANTTDPLKSYASIYSIIHGTWHILASWAQIYLIRMLTYVGTKLHTVKEYVQEVEVLNVLRNKYGKDDNHVYVRDKIKFRHKQELSPWTLYTSEHEFVPSNDWWYS